jgi:hypothetical protein
MKEICFPPQYKNALLSRTKNTTIRLGAELGKYGVGEIYSAKSYAGTPWNIKVRVLSVLPTTVGQLPKFGIPKQSVTAVQKEKCASSGRVELIRFEIL